MLYDLVILFVYFFVNLSLSIGSYLIFLESLKFKVKTLESIFGNFLLFNKEKMILYKNEKWSFFLAYFIYFLIAIIMFFIFLILIAFNSNNNILFISLYSLAFLICLALFIYYIGLSIKKISEYKFYNKLEIELNYSLSNKQQEYKTLLFLKDNKKSPYNNLFKFHQNRLKKKLNKDINNKKDNYKNYIIFLKYIRNHSTFIDRIINSNADVTIFSNNEIIDIEQLKTVLVNNFYALSRDN
ncbi:hypothetical protein SHELI_v1c03810 [Spiroplasma helicoides]|uniref:Uncharacterized protein n=1 Tax=Spiroplasma helicoides TaxID=216938 RepID=A0A1B3SK71_9MOLU|nr:hypothetical protein [Spiroplasma helicoides]AOG60334.1 hypothetical protein SHELI_v1c03810 [Spiroplasma helicoides]